MAIASWILFGGLAGFAAAAAARPGRFPGGRPGAAVTGAVGGFTGGGVFAALDQRAVDGLDPVTGASAVVGAGLMLIAMKEGDSPDRPPARTD